MDAHLSILDAIPLPIVLIDDAGRIDSANRFAVDLTGIGASLRGRAFADCFSLFTDVAALRSAIAIAREARPALLEAATEGAGPFIEWTIASASRDRLVLTGVDVTERLRRENELRDAIRYLDAIIDNLDGFAWVKDERSRFVVVNRAVAELAQRSRDEIAGTSDFDYFPAEQAEGFVRADAEVLSTGKEYRIVEPLGADEETHWLETVKRALYDESGRIVGTVGFGRDITRQRRAEIERERLTEVGERLRQSEQLFRSIANSAPVMLWMTDAEARCTFVNQRLLEFSGFPYADHLDDGWLAAIRPDQIEETRRELLAASAVRRWFRREVLYRRHDGEYREVLVEAAPRFNAESMFEGFIGRCLDLTDFRRLERRLEEEKRLSSLGRLAATIAHEMNNVLMAVQPFADVIRRTQDRRVLDRAASHIGKAVERGRVITHQILRFANSAAPNLHPVDVTSWLASLTSELHAILGPGIDLVIDEGVRSHIIGDPVQLHQVFTNLATNARDAMDRQGTFTISARPSVIAPGSNEEPSRHAVQFAISDSGRGIPRDIADRVFEPLFTTKATGTGLGLSIVRDIIRKHGGSISFDSGPRKGTTFFITLPSTEDVAAEESSSEVGWPSGVRRILLVEDDSSVSAGIAALLEMEGVEVEIAESARAALPAVESFRPDLVVLDVGLPDAPGTDAFLWIRAAHPTLPILFSTGHGGEDELQECLREPSTGYLLKPYGTAALFASIEEITNH